MFGFIKMCIFIRDSRGLLRGFYVDVSLMLLSLLFIRADDLSVKVQTNSRAVLYTHLTHTHFSNSRFLLQFLIFQQCASGAV